MNFFTWLNIVCKRLLYLISCVLVLGFASGVATAAPVVYELTVDGGVIGGTITFDTAFSPDDSSGGVDTYIWSKGDGPDSFNPAIVAASFNVAGVPETFDQSVFKLVVRLQMATSDDTPQSLFIDSDFASDSGPYLYTVSTINFGTGTGSIDNPYVAAITGAALTPDSGDPPPLDTDPPTPDPATFASAPSADGFGSISMVANTGTDPSGVEYYFEETSNNEGGSSSDWQTENSYTDHSLNPQTQYTYRVKMRDQSPQLNETGWSDPFSVTTGDIPSGECPDGDLDDDCDCDVADLMIFALQWLDPPGCVGHQDECADLNEQDGVNGADFAIFAANWQDAGVPLMLIINEMMASNSTAIADEHGEYDDWIEIFNPGPSAVLMSGMFLEDNDGFKWEIPPGISIDSGEYLLFWADDGSPTEGNLHTNFKLGASGDGVTLYDTDGITVIDTKSFSSMDTDISYGRYPDATDNWYNMADATPRAANAVGMSGEVYFSRPAGLFKGSFSLGLTTESGGATIRYTTNGSEPTASNGQVYTGSITVSNTAIIRAAAFESGYTRGPVETNSYISLDDVYSQPTQPAGFPDVWHDRSGVEPVDYGMDPDVIADYAAQLDDAFTSIPTMSIVMDMVDLFSWDYGIYPNSYASDQKPASVELIHSDGTEGFEINCNIRNHGAGSRDVGENLKHSFRLVFNGENGAATKLNYPLFEGSPVDQFDTIVLRGGSNFTWNNHGGDGDNKRYRAQCIRDIWARDTQLALGSPASRSIYVHLYLNGLYWGLYNTCERPNAPFLADHLGGQREDWDSINGSEWGPPEDPDPLKHEANVIDGDSAAWDHMTDNIVEGGLSSQSAYDDIQEYLDVENLIDFVIVQHYTQNTDWEESNWYVGRRRLPVAGFKFFLWDAEYAFFDVHRNMVTEDWPKSPRRIYNQLRANPEFRLLFADHLHRHFFNGGLMTTEPCRQRWMRRINELDSAIIGESARWGDAEENLINGDHPNGGVSYTRDDEWLTALDWILNDFMGFRTDILLGQYKGIGLYPNVDAPVFKINGSYQYGGYIPAGASLDMTKNGGGTIYYTTDGSDPRLQGGSVSGSASSSLPYTLNDTKHIKARVKDGVNWSALADAVYGDDRIADSIRITELMYHPTDPTSAEIAAVNPDPTDEDFEFIEVKNISGTALNLNLVHFTDGIDFTFGDYTLAAGAFAIIVKNQDAFEARYPGVSPSLIAGTYTGAINNGGERIELVDALGEPILNFRFKDGWYPITDGDDFSLNIIDPTNPDPNSWEYAQYWQPSTVAGGTPSDVDTGHVALPGDIVISEIMAHTNSSPNDWIELHNTSGSTINIAGWFLSDDDNDLKKYEIQAGDPRASIPPGGYVVFTQDDDFGDAFAYSELGETAYVCSGSSGELAGGFCTKEDFKASEDAVSFGRYTKSASAGYDVDFIPMTAPTYGTANTGSSPRVGPVVISEIMYHPDTANPLNSYAEYVELYNTSGSDVALYDTLNPSNTWLFTDEDSGITLYLPTGITISAGGRILLVKNLAAFTAEHGTPSVPAYEWLEGRLSNAGEKITLMKPGKPEPGGFVPYIRIDRVNYSDGYHHENFRELPSDPWPTSPDGGGDALHRSSLTSYGNDVGNWTAGTPTPGSPGS